MSGISIQAT